MRVVMGAFVAALLGVPAGAQTISEPLEIAQPTVSLAPGETLLQVAAHGLVKNRPDMMTLSAGAVTTGATAPEAIRANAELASRLIAAARQAGIQPTDVRTEALELSPRFSDAELERAESEGRAARILGYVARNSLEIRFRDLSRASEVMESLFAAGANEVRGPKFSLQDPTPAERAAERKAVAAARAEAENYALALGKRVSRILRVSEQGTRAVDYRTSIVVTGSRVTRTPIEPGDVETASTVYIDFALVDP